MSTNAEVTTCVKWSPASGTWVQSHTLRQRRWGHVSWATDSGVYLIGGQISSKTSEKVMLNGSVVESFGLKYDTRLHFAFTCQYSILYHSFLDIPALSLIPKIRN